MTAEPMPAQGRLAHVLHRNCHLTCEGICFRSHVAVRTQTLEESRWSKYLTGEIFESRQEEAKADSFIAQYLLQTKVEQIDEVIETISRMLRIGSDNFLNTILERWKQIRMLISQAYIVSIPAAVKEEVGSRDLLDSQRHLY